MHTRTQYPYPNPRIIGFDDVYLPQNWAHFHKTTFNFAKGRLLCRLAQGLKTDLVTYIYN